MSDPVFGGSTPQNYHEGLGPMLFEPYARDLAQRLQPRPGVAVLEVAAGTGIVTRRILERLPADGRLLATELGEPMSAVAQSTLPADRRLEWKLADACTLPFADAAFDAYICQFGLMFFADKVAALREARRVVRPGGQILVSVWGSLDENPIGRIAHDTVTSFFPDNPPQFYTVPFGLDEQTVIRCFEQAGVASVRCDTVDLVGESASAALAARGLVSGSPVSTAIAERDASLFPAITQAVAERLTAAGGAAPMRLPMRARVFTATP